MTAETCTATADQLLTYFDRMSEAPAAVQALRRFILDLAVRGKLVSQEASDGDASEVLLQVEAEKLRLINEGTIRKQELTPRVEAKLQPFQVPSTWEWVRFGGIADFSAGRTPSRHDNSYWNTGDYPWVSIADMQDGCTLTTTKESISEKAKTQVFSSEPVPPGTMLMSFKLTIGKISRLGVPAFHNEAIISIRPHLPAMDVFLFKLLPQFARRGVTKAAIKGATLNRESIWNLLLPIPPLAEQHRIVAKVDELMTLCDRLEAAQAKREQLRDRLAASSLHRLNHPAPHTRPADFHSHVRFHLNNLPRLTTRPNQIPALRQTILNLAVSGHLTGVPPEVIAEQTIELNCATDPRYPIGYGVLKPGPHYPGGVPLIKSQHVRDWQVETKLPDFISPELDAEFRRTKIKGGEVLLTLVGASIGRCAVVPPILRGANVSRAVAVITLKEQVSAQYIVIVLSAAFTPTRIAELATGTAQPVLNIGEIRKLPVWLPPLAEQHRIVAKVEELMALCDRLESHLTTTQSTSHRLLESILHSALGSASTELQE